MSIFLGVGVMCSRTPELSITPENDFSTDKCKHTIVYIFVLDLIKALIGVGSTRRMDRSGPISIFLRTYRVPGYCHSENFSR